MVELATYSEQSITSCDVTKILHTFSKQNLSEPLEVIDKHINNNTCDYWPIKALTTIFSAASHILSTFASDNPLIPVRFCKMEITV